MVYTALKAIEVGRLGVGEAFSGAMMARDSSRQRLEARIQTDPRPSIECVRAILEAAREHFAYHPRVQHVTWGAKTIKGQSVPIHALVVLVDQKRSELAESGPIPSSFETFVDGQRIEVPTDVRALAEGCKTSRLVRPGFQTRVESAIHVGTLSCLIPIRDEPHAIVSAHVAGELGQELTATTTTGGTYSLGRVKFLRNDEEVDAALVGPIAGVITELSSAPVPIRELHENETRVHVRIAVAREIGAVHASVEVASEPVTFVGPDGSMSRMRGMIRLDCGGTRYGDSGAPAFDDEGDLIGFVAGMAGGRTYLIPARRTINAIVGT